LILGLTGGYCTGKSTAAAFLKKEGWDVIDVDSLGHRALALRAAEVAGLIGPSALKPDGSPDRRAIGLAVFSDPETLGNFEAIVHPAMNALVAEAVASAGDKVCVDAALLYRLPVAESCDAIIEMRSPLLVRLRRARIRDGHAFRVVLDRIARQVPLRAASVRFSAKTIVVRNRGSEARLERLMRVAVHRAESLRDESFAALN
jgi:dephospho-CoA kinase